MPRFVDKVARSFPHCLPLLLPNKNQLDLSVFDENEGMAQNRDTNTMGDYLTAINLRQHDDHIQGLPGGSLVLCLRTRRLCVCCCCFFNGDHWLTCSLVLTCVLGLVPVQSCMQTDFVAGIMPLVVTASHALLTFLRLLCMMSTEQSYFFLVEVSFIHSRVLSPRPRKLILGRREICFPPAICKDGPCACAVFYGLRNAPEHALYHACTLIRIPPNPHS